MNEDTLKLYYWQHYKVSDSIAMSVGKEEISPGLDGTSIPYRLNADNGLTALLFLCFFLTAYVLTNGKKFLLRQLKDFVSVKERGNLFDSSTSMEIRYRIVLFFQTSVLLGICFFDYFHDNMPDLLEENPSFIILGINIGICIAYYLVKWLIYSVLGWIFFDRMRVESWLETYSTIVYYVGFALFPLVLLMVYFDLSSQILLPIEFSLVIFAKILMFYKWIKLFFNNLYGLFCLIAYFCALEIMPCFILFQALVEVNNVLVIKL